MSVTALPHPGTASLPMYDFDELRRALRGLMSDHELEADVDDRQPGHRGERGQHPPRGSHRTKVSFLGPRPHPLGMYSPDEPAHIKSRRRKLSTRFVNDRG